MPFSDLEARLNASVMKHLSNSEALFDGASDAVSGEFRKPYEASNGGVGMAGAAYTFRLADADVPFEPEGKRVTIRGVAYLVNLAEPDGTGLTTLILDLTV